MVTTESYMILRLSSCLVKLLHAGKKETPREIYLPLSGFDQLLSTNSLDLYSILYLGGLALW